MGPEFAASDLVMDAVLMLLGLIGHFLAKWRELRATKPRLSLNRYLFSNLPQTLFAVVSAAAGFIALHLYGELTPITALGCGWFCESVMDKLGTRSQKALG